MFQQVHWWASHRLDECSFDVFLTLSLLYFAYTCLRSELEWSRNPTMLSSQTGHDGVLWGQRLHRSRKNLIMSRHHFWRLKTKTVHIFCMVWLWQHFTIYKCLVWHSSPSCFTATWAWSTLWAVYAASQVLKFLSLHRYEAPGGSFWKGESSQKRFSLFSFSDSQRCKLPGAVSWVYCLKEALARLARCMVRDKTSRSFVWCTGLPYRSPDTLQDKFDFVQQFLCDTAVLSTS